MHKFDIKNIEKLDNPKRRQNMPPEETLNKFHIGDNGTFLDIGCGIGYFTIPAARIIKNGKVIGVDIVPEIITIAKEKVVNISNIEFKISNEYTFPIDGNSIDYVFISNVIHEIEDKLQYFEEIKRVLKKSGSLCIIDWEKKETEMGPPIDERISKSDIINFCEVSKLKFIEEINLNSDQYGLIFKLI